MNYRDLDTQIKQGDLGRVYLFYGEEAFVKQRMLGRLLSVAVAPEMADLNIMRMDETADAQSIIAACETLPVFAERRVVVYTDCPMLSTRGKDMGEAALSAYLEQVPEHAMLIFYMRGKPDGRKSLFKQLKKHAVVEFKPLTEREIYSWLNADLRRQGYTIDAQAAEMLVFRVGRDMGSITKEVEKALAYIYPDKAITARTIERLSTSSVEADAFEMMDYILSGDFRTAGQKLDAILQNGGAMQAVIGAINYRLQSLLAARILLDKGLSPQRAAQQMKGPRFGATRAVEQARRYTRDQLEQAVVALAEADYQIKSGRMRDRAAVEAAMVSAFPQA